MEQTVPLRSVSENPTAGFASPYSVAMHKMAPTENLVRRSMLAFQRTKRGIATNTRSVRVLKAALKTTLATALTCHRHGDTKHTLLVGHEQVEVARCAIVNQLLYGIFVQVRSTPEEAVENCRNGRDHADGERDIDEDEMPSPDNDPGEKDGKGQLDGQHRQDVAAFADDDPL